MTDNYWILRGTFLRQTLPGGAHIWSQQRVQGIPLQCVGAGGVSPYSTGARVIVPGDERGWSVSQVRVT